MGQEYSRPRPGTPLKVIGIGLPRTGTASLTAALEILLDGPVYHGGTQFVRGPEADVRGFTKILNQWPTDNPRTNDENRAIIRERFAGFAAVQDVPPLYAYLKDLPDMYPDAKFVCSVRDVGAWEESMRMVSDAAIPFLATILRLVLLPLPTLRLFPDYIVGLQHLMGTLFEEDTRLTRKTWEEHRQLVEEHIPRDRLVFVAVADGWGPLCEALDVPVPEGVPFPQINDAKAIDDFSKEAIRRGLLRWAAILGTAAAAAVAYRMS